MTHARTRGRRQAVESKRASASLAANVLRHLARIGRWAGMGIRQRLPRDLAALFLATVGVLLALALLGQTQETGLVGWIATGCRQLFGRGVLLVPLLFWWSAFELVASSSRQATARRMVGLGLYATGALALLDARVTDRVEEAGGYLGAGIATLLRFVGGEIGRGLLAIAFGLAGSILVAGIDLRTLVARGIGLGRVLSDHVARRMPGLNSSSVLEPPTVAPGQQGEATAALEPALTVITPQRHASANRLRNKRGTNDGQPRLERPTTPEPKATNAASVQPPARREDVLPALERLQRYEASLPNPEELQQKAAIIQETLANFRVDARVREIYPGPAVTLFTLEPGPGVKVRRITELQNDLALALAAPAIRIEAPVPGMARVGIEVPNVAISTVGLREVIESAAFQRSRARLPLALGRDVHGEYVIADLTRMPHLLIAGATGSGKSVCINSIIATFLLTRRPDELQMLLIDPKKVELAGYDGVPHLKRPVVTDMGLVVGALRRVLQEMERRYELFAQLGVRNLEGYRLRREEDPSLEPLPYLVVIIDELADLMLTTPDEVETLLVRLAQMARATGIHLLIATQRPSVDVLTGLIKANVPARIAFAVTSQTDSRVILDMPGAERLLGRGDMLYLPPDAARPLRVQGSFIEDRDLEYVVEHWRRFYPEPRYDPTWLDLEEAALEPNRGDDPLLEQARQLVRQLGTASTSLLQRRLRVGYNRAARIMEQLQAEGVVGPAEGARGRMVYLGDE